MEFQISKPLSDLITINLFFMKKLLLFASSLFIAFQSNAQNCSGLFFSEYVEGSNNNKALEIYNPTPNPITINGDYRIVRYNNGTSAAVAEVNNQAMVVLGQRTIQPYDVWVLVIDKRNPAGTGTELPVDAALQAVADTFVCPDYNTSYALYHNGNDALSLQRNVGGTWVYADIIGEIGVDPVNSWTDCPPLYDGSCGAYYTKDQTLQRKSGVQKGVSVNPSPFIAPAEWDSLPNNTFSGLGQHGCTCDPNYVGLKEKVSVKHSEVKLYPNPTTNVVTFLSADKKINAVRIFDVSGKLVEEINLPKGKIQFKNELKLTTGLYFVEIRFENGSITSEKLMIQ